MSTIPVREFARTDELVAHYRAVNHRTFNPPVAPKLEVMPPKPDMRKIVMEKIAARAAECRDDASARILDELRAPASVKALLKEVAERHEVTVGEILGSKRVTKIKDARWEAIILVHAAHPLWSLPKIGKLFNKDHTTILHCLRQSGMRRDLLPKASTYVPIPRKVIPEETIQAMIREYRSRRISQAEIGCLFGLTTYRVRCIFAERSVPSNQYSMPQPHTIKLTPATVREIKDYAQLGWDNKQIWLATGGVVGIRQLQGVRSGRCWKHVTPSSGDAA
jgi:hypothetical protein